MTRRHSPLALLMLMCIRLYQLTLSAFIGQHCRFQPTCSRYSAEAIRRFGAFRGGWMATRRIGRCHPWGQGGWDPVPEKHDA
ncbi:MAG: membrane protein insertion efficiency factor YidD [Phycisphaerales bacterium]|jgi:hypothetical protein|nr:membrane protein insertion efficiency factor YidD [Phycisphaerales bacterium]MDP6891306.1 membrane protein insertion efficiency factor YidD [Phycisphaerales bacterium]